MGKVRYLALLSQQPEELARFYTGYFNMKELGRSTDGDISFTDGYVNITVFKMRPSLREFEPRLAMGMNHLGVEVDSIEETVERYLKYNPKGLVIPEPGGLHYGEMRIHDPEFMPISLSEKGFGVPTRESQMPKMLHLALNAFHPPTVMEFYQQVFGLRPLEKSNAIRVRAGRLNRFMGDGTMNFAIHAFYTDYPGHEGHYGMNHMGFMVDDWKTITAEIGKKWPAAPRPANRPYEDARVEDPDGNKIDIGQTKGWEIDNDVWVQVA
jgi:catechol 2,3-dioxygenase-like lactoylglutathione lyase family enzyme